MDPTLDCDGGAWALSQEQEVAVFELREGVLGAIADLAQKTEMIDRLDRVANDPGIRAILFRNRHDAFSQVEVRRFHEQLYGERARVDTLTADITLDREECGLAQLVEALQVCRPLTVIALQSEVVGPFFGFSLAFDVRLCARDAVLSAAPLDGVPCGGGLGWFLPHFVGLGRARQILMAGEQLPAWRARELGLISGLLSGGDVVSQTLAATHKVALGGLEAGEVRRLSSPFTLEELSEAFDREGRILKRAWHRRTRSADDAPAPA